MYLKRDTARSEVIFGKLRKIWSQITTTPPFVKSYNSYRIHNSHSAVSALIYMTPVHIALLF